MILNQSSLTYLPLSAVPFGMYATSLECVDAAERTAMGSRFVMTYRVTVMPTGALFVPSAVGPDRSGSVHSRSMLRRYLPL